MRRGGRAAIAGPSGRWGQICGGETGGVCAVGAWWGWGFFFFVVVVVGGGGIVVAVLRESQLLGPARRRENATVVGALGRRGKGGWIAEGRDGGWLAVGARVSGAVAAHRADDGADFVADAEGALIALGFWELSALYMLALVWMR